MNAQRYGRLGLSLAAALLGSAVAPAVFGQGSPGDDEAAAGPPLYRVEIIVFAYNQGDPSEEDFAHIARRESIERSAGPGEIAEFDFGQYVPGVTREPGDQTSPRSRLLLGGNDESENGPSERNAANDSTGSSGGAQSGSGVDTGAGPAASDPSLASPAETDGGLAGAEAEVDIDPFGDAPGNAVAPFRFRLLAQDELELTDLRRRLERVESVYTPLVHGGWIQEGLPPQQAKPFDLAYLGASTPSGTIRLHLTRFVHLTLDLDYRAFMPGGVEPIDVPNENVPGSGVLGIDETSPSFGARSALSELEVSRRFHLGGERRIRSGEVHYFDHPFFGVIAVVKPYEPPEPPSTEGVRPAA